MFRISFGQDFLLLCRLVFHLLTLFVSLSVMLQRKCDFLRCYFRQTSALLVKILCVNQHQVYDLLGPSVCLSTLFIFMTSEHLHNLFLNPLFSVVPYLCCHHCFAKKVYNILIPQYAVSLFDRSSEDVIGIFLFLNWFFCSCKL